MNEEEQQEDKKTFFNIEEINHKGKKIYVKKRPDGTYKLVYPIVKDINKSFWEKGNKNWKNFIFGGSYISFAFTILIIASLLFVVWAYNHDVEVCMDIYERTSNNLCYRSCIVAQSETFSIPEELQREFQGVVNELNLSLYT